MGCVTGVSLTSYKPLNIIRKGSKKIWRILLGKNASVYSVKKAFVRHENFRESRYSKVEMEETKYEQNFKSVSIEKNEEDLKSNDEENIQSTIAREIMTKNDNINKDSSENHENIPDIKEASKEPKEKNYEYISPELKSNNEDLDSLPNRGRTFIVEVHLENSKFSDENESDNTSVEANRSSENFPEEQEQNLLLSDENSTSNKSIPENIRDNELERKNNHDSCESNEAYSISKKKHEDNSICETSSEKKFETEQTPRRKQPENHFSEYKENRPENTHKHVTHLVNLFEQQIIPSPIHKITSAKRPPLATLQHKIEKEKLNFDNLNSTKFRTETPGKKTCIANSKEYDLIDYSSFRIESLMTQFDSQCHRRSGVENTVFSSETIPNREDRSETLNGNRTPMKNLERTKLLQETAVSPRGKFDLVENSGVTSDEKENDHKQINGWKKSSAGDTNNPCNDVNVPRQNPTDRNVLYWEKTLSIHVKEISRESEDFKLGDSGSNESYCRSQLTISHKNVHTASFSDLNGLVETRVDTSCDSIPTDLGESPESSGTRNRSAESGRTQSDEITVEYTTLERSKTENNVEERIPSSRMNKLQTLFKKSSLNHLYRFMQEAHNELDSVETQIDEDIEKKFVLNVYGPSKQKRNNCC